MLFPRLKEAVIVASNDGIVWYARPQPQANCQRADYGTVEADEKSSVEMQRSAAWFRFRATGDSARELINQPVQCKARRGNSVRNINVRDILGSGPPVRP